MNISNKFYYLNHYPIDYEHLDQGKMAVPTEKWYMSDEYVKSQARHLWIKHLHDDRINVDETRKMFLDVFHVRPEVWNDYKDDYIVGASVELEHGKEGGDITNVTDDDPVETAKIAFK